VSQAAFAQDALLPQPAGGHRLGAVLALLAHAGLVLALTLGVQWRTQSPDVVVAELWASVPRNAAPLPPPPALPTALPATPPPAPPMQPPAVAPPAPKPAPPAPRAPPTPAPLPPAREADIAVEQDARAKARELAEAERQRQEAARLRAAKAAEEARKRAELKAAEAKKAEQDRQDRQDRQERLQRQAALDKAQAEEQASKERQDREERRRAEAERKAQAEARAKAEEERLAKQREENLRRIMGQAGANTDARTPADAPTGSGASNIPGSAAQSAAPSAGYAGRLIALIRPNIVFTGAVSSIAAAEVEVRTAAGGSILSRRLIKSSGNADWDEAVLRAIDRTGTLPRDNDGRVPSTLVLVFKPRD